MRIGNVAIAVALFTSFIAACAGSPAPAAPQPAVPAPAVQPPAPAPLGSALDQLVARLGETLAAARTEGEGNEAAPGHRIAVVPFPDPAGKESDFSRAVAERLATRLAGRPGIRVVERGRMEYLAQEVKLQFSELSDPATATRLGRILGANRLLTGTHEPAGGKVTLLARVVDTETAEVLAGAEAECAFEAVTAPPPAPAAAQLKRRLDLDLAVLGERKVGGTASNGGSAANGGGERWSGLHVTDGTSLVAGDQFQLHITPTQDCELYVLFAGSSGRVVRVYPDSGVGDLSRVSRVPARHTIRIPAPVAGHEWFVLDATPGAETIFVVAWLPDAPPEGLAALLQSVRLWDQPAEGQAVMASLADLEARIAEQVAFKQKVAGFRGTVQVLKRAVPEQSFKLSDGSAAQLTPEALEGTGVAVKRVRIEHR